MRSHARLMTAMGALRAAAMLTVGSRDKLLLERQLPLFVAKVPRSATRSSHVIWAPQLPSHLEVSKTS